MTRSTADSKANGLIALTAQEARSAGQVIAGFHWQVLRSASRCLCLRPDDVLVLEGSEDIQMLSYDQQRGMFTITEEQLKHLSGGVSARSPAVYESIFNFAIAFTTIYAPSAISVHFRLLTTAYQARQVTDEDLSVDLLADWDILPIDRFQAAVRVLVRRYGDAWATSKRAKLLASKRERLADALAYLDSESAWGAFRSSVHCDLKAGDIQACQNHLREEVQLDARVSPRTNPELVVDALVRMCFSRASNVEHTGRRIRRRDVNALLAETELSALSNDFRVVQALAADRGWPGTRHIFAADISVRGHRAVCVLQQSGSSLTAELIAAMDSVMTLAVKVDDIDWPSELQSDPWRMTPEIEVALTRVAASAPYIAFVTVARDGQLEAEMIATSLWVPLNTSGNRGTEITLSAHDALLSNSAVDAAEEYARQCGFVLRLQSAVAHEAGIVLAAYAARIALERICFPGMRLAELFDTLREKVRVVTELRTESKPVVYAADTNPLP